MAAPFPPPLSGAGERGKSRILTPTVWIRPMFAGALSAPLAPIALLLCSNVFTTFA